MTVLCIQEAHMQRYGVFSIRSNYGKSCLLYYCRHQTKSINRIGILVEENRQVNFKPISNRICKITIKLTNSGNKKFISMSVYAPTLECSEKNPDTTDIFCNELERVTKKVKSRDNLLKAGNFNLKTGTTALESSIYKKQTGKYGKGKANINGYRLFELEKSQSLKLTNIFFTPSVISDAVVVAVTILVHLCWIVFGNGCYFTCFTVSTLYCLFLLNKNS